MIHMLFWAAVTLVAVLTIVALYYHWRLHRQQRTRKQQQALMHKQAAQRNTRNVQSIIIIARALVEEQVSLTEASIRINTLAQALPLEANDREKLLVFRQLSEATAHIPILDRWQSLSKNEKQSFDKEREKIEEKYREFVRAAAQNIIKGEVNGIVIVNESPH